MTADAADATAMQVNNYGDAVWIATGGGVEDANHNGRRDAGESLIQLPRPDRNMPWIRVLLLSD